MKNRSEENCKLIRTWHRKQVSPLVILMEYCKLILAPKFKLKRKEEVVEWRLLRNLIFSKFKKKNHEGNFIYFLNIPCSVVKPKQQL